MPTQDKPTRTKRGPYALIRCRNSPQYVNHSGKILEPKRVRFRAGNHGLIGIPVALIRQVVGIDNFDPFIDRLEFRFSLLNDRSRHQKVVYIDVRPTSVEPRKKSRGWLKGAPCKLHSRHFIYISSHLLRPMLGIRPTAREYSATADRERGRLRFIVRDPYPVQASTTKKRPKSFREQDV